MYGNQVKGIGLVLTLGHPLVSVRNGTPRFLTPSARATFQMETESSGDQQHIEREHVDALREHTPGAPSHTQPEFAHEQEENSHEERIRGQVS